MSGVSCHNFFKTKCWSYAGEGLLSAGPTPYSLFKYGQMTLKDYIYMFSSFTNIDTSVGLCNAYFVRYSVSKIVSSVTDLVVCLLEQKVAFDKTFVAAKGVRSK